MSLALNTAITDPNDPRFKEQNKLRLIISLLEFTQFEQQALTRLRQHWISEAQNTVEQIFSTKIDYEEKRTNTLKQTEEREEIQSRPKEIKNNLEELISAASQIALQTVQTTFKNNPPMQTIASKIVTETFNPQLPQKTAQIVQGISAGKISLDHLLTNAHPTMHAKITRAFNEVQNSTTAKDALINGTLLTTTLEYAAGMKTALKRELTVVQGREPTSTEMHSVQNIEKDMLLVTTDTAFIAFSRNGQTQQLALTETTTPELLESVITIARERAEEEGEMGLRELFGEQTNLTYFNSQDLTEPQTAQLLQRLDTTVERAGGSSVGQKKAEQAQQLEQFHTDSITPIVQSMAAAISKVTIRAVDDPALIGALVSTASPSNPSMSETTTNSTEFTIAVPRGSVINADGSVFKSDTKPTEPKPQ